MILFFKLFILFIIFLLYYRHCCIANFKFYFHLYNNDFYGLFVVYVVQYIFIYEYNCKYCFYIYENYRVRLGYFYFYFIGICTSHCYKFIILIEC